MTGLLLCTAVLGAVSQGPARAVGGESAAATDPRRAKALSMRLDLLERLVTAPESVSKIEVDGDDEARALLSRARGARDRAARALRAGDLDAAEEATGAGIKAIGDASRRVVRQSKATERHVERHQALRERIASFWAAFERVAAEKDDPAVRALLDETRARRLMARAERQHEQGEYAAANETLAEVASMVEHALAAARAKETLVHALSFASPEEEYAYEQQRNHSYRLLVEVLEQQRKLTGPGLEYLQRMVARNEQVRKEADALQAEGEVEAAIELLERGTESLAKALRASGVGF